MKRLSLGTCSAVRTHEARSQDFRLSCRFQTSIDPSTHSTKVSLGQDGEGSEDVAYSRWLLDPLLNRG